MAFEIGVLFAIGALVFWAFGDFLIQKSARRIGDWETLFITDMTGAIVLLPLIFADLPSIMNNQSFFILGAASIALLIASLLDYESLRRGKIAVVEPVYALEVPVAALLAYMIIAEAVEPLHLLLVISLLTGVVLVSLKSHHLSRRRWLERGVLLTLVGAVFMGSANFFLGFASRVTNPLMASWFTNMVTGTAAVYYLMVNKKLGNLMSNIKNSSRVAGALAFFDNAAWISFAVSASLIPIAIASAISESYIALAAFFGLAINKERLMKHQKAGLVIAVVSVAALAAVYA